MKKIPLVFSGCLLGLVGAGNLLADSLPFLAHAFSLTGLTFLLYPLIYHDLKQSPLPSHLLGQEGIYCAPFSLLLAALVRVGGASLPTWFLLIMVVASQGFYFFVLTRLPKMIKEGFQPAFSALTFPTVITATSLKMAQGLLQLPFLTALVWLETLLCLLILVAVVGGYVAYLRE